MYPVTAITIAILIRVLICSVNANASNSHNSMDRTMQIFRNQYYRVCVWKKAKTIVAANKKNTLRTKIAEIREKIRAGTLRIYDSAMFNYTNYSVSYYGLSQEERELIEQIIGLHF